ncbi:hypothetical protein WJX75_006407 [Coccomyxa subellipsoidea]|uniref:Uncharacterized protein n=1 Tax=Coccomyxa subellipsoidea TaxID=248742 RepID=A0ABR2YD50_9CHLO
MIQTGFGGDQEPNLQKLIVAAAIAHVERNISGSCGKAGNISSQSRDWDTIEFKINFVALPADYRYRKKAGSAPI